VRNPFFLAFGSKIATQLFDIFIILLGALLGVRKKLETENDWGQKIIGERHEDIQIKYMQLYTIDIYFEGQDMNNESILVHILRYRCPASLGFIE
jgi:hypothetical protein